MTNTNTNVTEEKDTNDDDIQMSECSEKMSFQSKIPIHLLSDIISYLYPWERMQCIVCKEIWRYSLFRSFGQDKADFYDTTIRLYFMRCFIYYQIDQELCVDLSNAWYNSLTLNGKKMLQFFLVYHDHLIHSITVDESNDSNSEIKKFLACDKGLKIVCQNNSSIRWYHNGMNFLCFVVRSLYNRLSALALTGCDLTNDDVTVLLKAIQHRIDQDNTNQNKLSEIFHTLNLVANPRINDDCMPLLWKTLLQIKSLRYVFLSQTSITPRSFVHFHDQFMYHMEVVKIIPAKLSIHLPATDFNQIPPEINEQNEKMLNSLHKKIKEFDETSNCSIFCQSVLKFCRMLTMFKSIFFPYCTHFRFKMSIAKIPSNGRRGFHNNHNLNVQSNELAKLFGPCGGIKPEYTDTNEPHNKQQPEQVNWHDVCRKEALEKRTKKKDKKITKKKESKSKHLNNPQGRDISKNKEQEQNKSNQVKKKKNY
ncbi:hypothetical protein RFI_09613 [Reticulomyxa filosa]|uniref:Uncharacterized protein n=1 Tax=Reticulomyxa filosa TaxID=46433 RepID=X6NNL2_RETFI|nr:hypothetical protein RFI_09613 [Reticulomyxa filosa]|eukprot:ETO27518.1 hypothetical protein RFI_09613 [Reticulomyxa filosa]